MKNYYGEKIIEVLEQEIGKKYKYENLIKGQSALFRGIFDLSIKLLEQYHSFYNG